MPKAFFVEGGWREQSNGAKCRRVLIWISFGQGLTVFSVGADGGCLDIFFSRLLSPLSL